MNIAVARQDLVAHLRAHSVRTDGPFTLRSGQTSAWYLDARVTTFDGTGAGLVATCVLDCLPAAATAIGGMTMGADPIAVATAIAAARAGRHLRAFSVRKQPKEHGVGGRLVGPVRPEDRVVVVDDTVTTGGALFEAIDVLAEAAIAVEGAVVLVDRSGGTVAASMADRAIPYRALVLPADLGVGE